jgi:hypothetical protein
VQFRFENHDKGLYSPCDRPLHVQALLDAVYEIKQVSVLVL